ncbi:hypothetical protein ACL6C3_04490 [Capilliphycus salinus ALCB114379]|uniref:hypothetical protein n=1 Tax=Capilliphycus salinus TaxID=2768948 RepID=UPI0039A6D31D
MEDLTQQRRSHSGIPPTTTRVESWGQHLGSKMIESLLVIWSLTAKNSQKLSNLTF